MTFECQYCPAVSPDLSGLIRHFEDEHRDKTEYIELEVTPDMLKPITEVNK
ncbi:unnamed protein product [marine sediment metagenome]|uniref:C2H2-type domain-containing protein n=1 Tax=marine sediment metagenome TaxID=412755 RepID=X1SJW2_9ZZZZ